MKTWHRHGFTEETYHVITIQAVHWLSPTENWLTHSANCLKDNSSAWTPQVNSSFIKDVCLQLPCLAIVFLLFHVFAWCRPQKTGSPILLSLSWGWGVYQPSHRNGGSFTVDCIHSHENVYEHSSTVIEMAHMSHYASLIIADKTSFYGIFFIFVTKGS